MIEVLLAESLNRNNIQAQDNKGANIIIYKRCINGMTNVPQECAGVIYLVDRGVAEQLRYREDIVCLAAPEFVRFSETNSHWIADGLDQLA